MSNPLALKAMLNTGYVPVASQPRLVYALLAVEANELQPQPIPVSLALVVDDSLSMRIPLLTEEQFRELAELGAIREIVKDGVPMWEFERVPPGFIDQCPRAVDFVKVAILQALETLRPDDHCGLIAFAEHARQLVSLQPASRRHKLAEALDRLDRLDLGDQTRLAKGLALAVKELKRHRPCQTNVLRRVLVLTDGFALDAEEAMRWGSKAAEAGISVSTMGLGAEFNDELLVTLADVSNGNAYLIMEAVDVPEAFAKELSAVQSVVLRDLELKLRLYGGVELRRAYRVRPSISDLGTPSPMEGATSFALGDLDPQAPPALLLELIVPPRQEGRYRLAQAMLAHLGPDGQPGPKVTADLVVEVGNDTARAAQYNPQVMNLVETVSAFKLQTRALADAERGDMANATVKLRAAATRLLGLGEVELAQAALQEAENLEQKGALSAAGTKRLRYETRRLTQRLE